MRLPRGPWLLSFAGLGALLGSQAAGCGSNSTIHPFGTGGSGGGGTSSSGMGGMTSSSSGGGMGGAGMAVCGDGKIEGTEQCDLGTANGAGMGCNSSCGFDCIHDQDCNMLGNTCPGMATCVAGMVMGQMIQTCQPGTPLADGASCGTNMICLKSNCVAPSCGDGFVEAPEECDDGNITPGDGCENDCKLTCLATDPTRNCSSTNACVGNGTCGATHTCTLGANAPDGTACGSGQICTAGVCGAGACGDGFVTAPEQCDFGTAGNVAGSGCQPNCTFTCAKAPNSCDDGNPCNGVETCNAVTGPNGTPGQKCAPGTNLPNGTACGGGKVCTNGVCSTPGAVCGNGKVETGEQCDLGAMNGTGAGCSATCQFDCQTSANCTSANACVASGTCTPTTVNGQNVQKCVAGANAAKCASCPSGLCNGAGTCAASVCGDGCVDASKTETCDPPNGTTCDATCHKVIVAVCGNGVLEAGEQCDDGNKFNLDGCDSSCKYEVVSRMTSIAIAGTPAPAALKCAPATNALGAKALTGTALGQINPQLQTAITGSATVAPTVNVMTQFLGLTDLTGTAASGFQIGVLDATLDPAKGTWPGNNPIDWWFLADPAAVSMGLPTGKFTTTSLAAHNLAAGPSNVTLILNLGGSPAALTMLGAHLAATINANPAPNVPAPPPAALAAGLVVFQTITGNGAGQGLCGNITVGSLAQIPVPSALTSGAGNCGQGYVPCTGTQTPQNSACNSLLDVLVSGCTVFGGFVTVVNKTQPDVPAGATVMPLVAGAGRKITPDPSADMDAYSSYMTFTANRAHFTGESCALTSDCQTGKTCTAGVCK